MSRLPIVQRITARLLLLSLAFLSGCQWVERQDAEAVGERFVKAAVTGDFAALHDCTEPERGYDNAKDFIERELGMVDVKRRLDGLSIEIVAMDEERATLQAVGTLRYQVPFMAATAPIEWELELVKTRHRWVVRDVDSL